MGQTIDDRQTSPLRTLLDRFSTLSDWRRLAVGGMAAAAAEFVFSVILVFGSADDDLLFMCLLAYWTTLAVAAYGAIGAAGEEGRLNRPVRVFAVTGALLAAWFGTIVLTYLFDHVAR